MIQCPYGCGCSDPTENVGDALNCLRCPRCGGVGGWEDFGFFQEGA